MNTLAFYENHLIQLIGASWNYLDKENPYVLEYYEYTTDKTTACRYKCAVQLSYKITHGAGVIGNIEQIKQYINNNWYTLLASTPAQDIKKNVEVCEPIPHDILLELCKHAVKV